MGGATWPEQWRSPEPRASYDVVIVGAGGHGLATAYYLACEHGIRNVAVLERGWLGGGNTGRNTTIIRSNYLWEESAALYEHALKLWEGLAQELNYNVMYSPRGVMMLAHSVHDVQVFKRHVHANRLSGIDNEWLTPEQAKSFCPPLNISPGLRYPIVGAALQRRGGVARHDAVAWGYARGASAARCRHHSELRGDGDQPRAVRRRERGRNDARTHCGAQGRGGGGWPQQRGDGDGRTAHAAGKLSVAGAGVRAGEAGAAVRGHVEQHPRLHLAVRQRRAGDRRGTDAYVSYSQAGGLYVAEHTLEAICELFPTFRRLRILRNWGGIVDVTPDRSPIIGLTPVPGLYVNCGWGTGGFKATPGSGHVFAATIARGEPHPIAAPFSLDRFRNGRLIDEAAAAAVAH